MSRYSLIIILIVLFVIVVSIVFVMQPQQNIDTENLVLITRVIDGDTVELENEERVRLLGIDTPEKGQLLYSEASERLRELVEGKSVLLESDQTNRDKYDRLLRNVILNRQNINILMVKEGYAFAYIIEPDHRYESELRTAQSYAHDNNLGIWQYESIENGFCIGISWFQYNAAGDDNENLNGEYIEFRNKCTYPLELTGWKLSDATEKTYVFDSFVIENKTTFKLYTGSGEDSETKLYWGQIIQAVWNNDGDHLQMRNDKNELVLDYEY
ncbi:MAG: thermonuclease family protein [Nanoarchaeota archaeon]|nr:thermonuclease family protein [Nanoarchaeota archaeon]MBU1135290.1 thermonuclease family protein [Nanoarchaeota archaeon]MBU2520333.1 thermonuclease family protein [Nanoarchaeota archaeon]